MVAAINAFAELAKEALPDLRSNIFLWAFSRKNANNELFFNFSSIDIEEDDAAVFAFL
jgi:hypothetical protein